VEFDLAHEYRGWELAALILDFVLLALELGEHKLMEWVNPPPLTAVEMLDTRLKQD